jgi:hypothetical protein
MRLLFQVVFLIGSAKASQPLTDSFTNERNSRDLWYLEQHSNDSGTTITFQESITFEPDGLRVALSGDETCPFGLVSKPVFSPQSFELHASFTIDNFLDTSGGFFLGVSTGPNPDDESDADTGMGVALMHHYINGDAICLLNPATAHLGHAENRDDPCWGLERLDKPGEFQYKTGLVDITIDYNHELGTLDVFISRDDVILLETLNYSVTFPPKDVFSVRLLTGINNDDPFTSIDEEILVHEITSNLQVHPAVMDGNLEGPATTQ